MESNVDNRRKEVNKMIAAVVYIIHQSVPNEHIPKLFIKDVPDSINSDDLEDLLSESGYKFYASGIPWANHYIQLGITNAHPNVRSAWRKGYIRTIGYSDLLINRGKNR